MLGEYYRLTKPGEIYGNSLTAVAGFLLGSKWHISLPAFLALLVGLGLVMAGSLVLNNWTDRGIDRQMTRTRGRALASGKIPVRNALIFAGLLLAGGFWLLSYTNTLTMLVALVGFIDYVILYGLAKRRTTWSTIIGSVSGAVPIAAGYAAATGRFDTGAWLLFAIMTVWQMPHFYSIGIFRRDEYAAAGLPIRPVNKGAAAARQSILWYMASFLLGILLLTYFGYTGLVFAGIMGAVSVLWLWKGLTVSTADYTVWGRQIFRWSLVVLLCLSVMLSIAPVLP